MHFPGKSGVSTPELEWPLEPACDAATTQGAGMAGIWVILLTFRLSCLPDEVAGDTCTGKEKREMLE